MIYLAGSIIATVGEWLERKYPKLWEEEMEKMASSRKKAEEWEYDYFHPKQEPIPATAQPIGRIIEREF